MRNSKLNIPQEEENFQPNKTKENRTNRWISILLILIVLIGGSGFAISQVYDKQVNFLVMGIEGTRTDTLIFVSVDTHNNTVKAMSIPRDTYFPTEGKNGAGQKKINAVYGFKEIGGADGVVRTVEKLLGVSIDHYVKVDYEGVADIVDLIGGVEVDVPYSMVYDDPYANPPLHIDFEPGVQTLTGENAIGYLRFRKSNDGKIREGDVQRIERQQAFLISAAKSLISPKLPYVIYRATTYVETDISALDAAVIGAGILGFTEEDITMTTLPMDSIGTGSDGLSYFFYDEAATKELMNTWIR